MVTPVLWNSLVVRHWAVGGGGFAYKAGVDVAADLPLAGWFDCLRGIKAKPCRSAR